MEAPPRAEGDLSVDSHWDPTDYAWDGSRLVASRIGTGAFAETACNDDGNGGDDPMEGDPPPDQPQGGRETCMVKDCRVDLSLCKAYYRRFRICERHLKTLSLCIEGKPSRFCQQCGRFHLLEEFERNKRSCRRALLARFYKRRNLPVPLHVLPDPQTDGGPEQESPDTDAKSKAKMRDNPTDVDPNPVRRKRGRPRAPAMDVRDLSLDDPRVADLRAASEQQPAYLAQLGQPGQLQRQHSQQQQVLQLLPQQGLQLGQPVAGHMTHAHATSQGTAEQAQPDGCLPGHQRLPMPGVGNYSGSEGSQHTRSATSGAADGSSNGLSDPGKYGHHPSFLLEMASVWSPGTGPGADAPLLTEHPAQQVPEQARGAHPHPQPGQQPPPPPQSLCHSYPYQQRQQQQHEQDSLLEHPHDEFNLGMQLLSQRSGSPQQLQQHFPQLPQWQQDPPQQPHYNESNRERSRQDPTDESPSLPAVQVERRLQELENQLHVLRHQHQELCLQQQQQQRQAGQHHHDHDHGGQPARPALPARNTVGGNPSGDATCSGSDVGENLSRLERHMFLLRQPSDATAAASSAMIRLAAGASGGGGSGSEWTGEGLRLGLLDSSPWGNWGEPGAKVSGLAATAPPLSLGGTGAIGAGRVLGPVTTDPLELELLSIASESLLADQSLRHGGLAGSNNLVLGLPQAPSNHTAHQPPHLPLQPQHLSQLPPGVPSLPSAMPMMLAARGPGPTGPDGEDLNLRPLRSRGGLLGSGGSAQRAAMAVPNLRDLADIIIDPFGAFVRSAAAAAIVNTGRSGGRGQTMPSALPASGATSGGSGGNSRQRSDSPGVFADTCCVTVDERVGRAGGFAAPMDALPSQYADSSMGRSGWLALSHCTQQPPQQQGTAAAVAAADGGGFGMSAPYQGDVSAAGDERTHANNQQRQLAVPHELTTADEQLAMAQLRLQQQYEPPPPQQQQRWHHDHHQPHRQLPSCGSLPPPPPHTPHPGEGGALHPNLVGVTQNLLAQGGSRATYSPPANLLERVSIKIHNCRPEQLPRDLAEQMAQWLLSADTSVLQGFLRPGCTNLILDVLHGDADRLVSELVGATGTDPRVAAERLMRAVTGSGPDFASNRPMNLHLQFGDMLLVVEGEQVRLRSRGAPAGPLAAAGASQLGRRAAPPSVSGESWYSQELLGVAPLAVVAGWDFTLELAGRGLNQSGSVFHVRFRGGHLEVFREIDSEECEGFIASNEPSMRELDEQQHQPPQQRQSPLSAPQRPASAGGARGGSSGGSNGGGAGGVAGGSDEGARGITLMADGGVDSGDDKLAAATSAAAVVVCAGSASREALSDGRGSRAILGPQAEASAIDTGQAPAAVGGPASGECQLMPLSEAAEATAMGAVEGPTSAQKRLWLTGGSEAMAMLPYGQQGAADGEAGEWGSNDGVTGAKTCRLAAVTPDDRAAAAAPLPGWEATFSATAAAVAPAAAPSSTAAAAAPRAPGRVPSGAGYGTNMEGAVGVADNDVVAAPPGGSQDRAVGSADVTARRTPELRHQAPLHLQRRDGGVSGGGGSPFEAHSSDIGDGDDTDQPSCLLRSSNSSFASNELDVVVLFVEPAPYAGLALVEVEGPPPSPPLSHHQQQQQQLSQQSLLRSAQQPQQRLPQAFQDAGRTLSGGGRNSPSSGSNGNGSGYASGYTSGGGVAVTPGVLSEWWPVVIVPQAAAEAAAELNTLLEERDTAWLRNMLVDFGLVLEALDPIPAGGLRDVAMGAGAGTSLRGVEAEAAEPASVPNADDSGFPASNSSGVTWGSGSIQQCTLRPSHGMPSTNVSSTNTTSTCSSFGQPQEQILRSRLSASASSASCDLGLDPAQQQALALAASGGSMLVQPPTARPPSYSQGLSGLPSQPPRVAAMEVAAPTGTVPPTAAVDPELELWQAFCNTVQTRGLGAQQPASLGALAQGGAIAAADGLITGQVAASAAATLQPLSDPGVTRRTLNIGALAAVAAAYNSLLSNVPVETAARMTTGQPDNLTAGGDVEGAQATPAQTTAAAAPLAAVNTHQPAGGVSAVSLETSVQGGPSRAPPGAAQAGASGTGSVGAASALPQRPSVAPAQVEAPLAAGSGLATGAVQALQESVAARQEKVVEMWRRQQQEQLGARARTLLVFFCNRGFHYCAQLMLDFLLRSPVPTGATGACTSAAATAATAASTTSASPAAATSTCGASPAAEAASSTSSPRVSPPDRGAFCRLAEEVRLDTGLGLLHHAVRSGSLETVALILGTSRMAGAPLDVVEAGPSGVTPAHMAALLASGGPAITQAMIEHVAITMTAAAAAKRLHGDTTADPYTAAVDESMQHGPQAASTSPPTSADDAAPGQPRALPPVLLPCGDATALQPPGPGLERRALEGEGVAAARQLSAGCGSMMGLAALGAVEAPHDGGAAVAPLLLPYVVVDKVATAMLGDDALSDHDLVSARASLEALSQSCGGAMDADTAASAPAMATVTAPAPHQRTGGRVSGGDSSEGLGLLTGTMTAAVVVVASAAAAGAAGHYGLLALVLLGVAALYWLMKGAATSSAPQGPRDCGLAAVVAKGPLDGAIAAGESGCGEGCIDGRARGDAGSTRAGTMH